MQATLPEPPPAAPDHHLRCGRGALTPLLRPGDCGWSATSPARSVGPERAGTSRSTSLPAAPAKAAAPATDFSPSSPRQSAATAGVFKPFSPSLRAGDTAFIADWRNMVFLHYAVPPAILAPHVPVPLDVRDGRAYVSLVFFTQERLRPPGTGWPGRLAFRPVSDHPFLNVRTYVRHAGTDGIHFLAEWIPNRLNCWLGPRTYGLPYRHGQFASDLAGRNGVGHVCVRDPALAAELNITFPVQPAPLAECAPGSLDAFLLERYRAHTHRRGVLRRFDVAHEPWRVRPLDWVRCDTALLTKTFPWFAHAEFVCAHATPGATDVRMGFPHRA